MANDEKPLDLPDLMEILPAYWQSRAALTGQELGLFEALAEGPLALPELAAKLDCNDRALGLLAHSLAGLGLLTKRDEQFANAPFTDEHLVESHGGVMVGYLKHHAVLWSQWNELTRIVRTGEVERAEFEEDTVRAFIMAMHTTSNYWRGRVADHIDLTGVGRVIDVGGGSGDYAYEILQRIPEATAVIFDRPDVVPITMECAEMAGVADRVETVGGDFWEDELGEGFDLAICSNVLHGVDPDQCVTLLAKTFRCLKPGGRTVIHDFVLDPDGTKPPYAALFSLNMLTAGRDGRSYTQPEFGQFLKKAGFASAEYASTSGDTGIVVGRKA